MSDCWASSPRISEASSHPGEGGAQAMSSETTRSAGRYVNTQFDLVGRRDFHGGSADSHSGAGSRITPSSRLPYHPSHTPRAMTPRPSTPRTPTTPRTCTASRPSTPRLSTPRGSATLRSPLPLSGGMQSRFSRRVIVAGEEDDLDAVSVLTESTAQSVGHYHDMEERLHRYRSSGVTRNSVPMSPHYENEKNETDPMSSSHSRLSVQTSDERDRNSQYKNISAESPLGARMTRSISSRVHDAGENTYGHNREMHCKDRQQEESTSGTNARTMPSPRTQVSQDHAALTHHVEERADSHDRHSGHQAVRQYSQTLDRQSNDAQASSSSLQVARQQASPHDQRSQEVVGRIEFTEQLLARNARANLEKALLSVEAVTSSRTTSGNIARIANPREVTEKDITFCEESPRRHSFQHSRSEDDENVKNVPRHIGCPVNDDTSTGGNSARNRVEGRSISLSSSTFVQQFESPRNTVSFDYTGSQNLHVSTIHHRDVSGIKATKMKHISAKYESKVSKEKNADDVREELELSMRNIAAEKAVLENRLERSTLEKKAQEEDTEKMVESARSEIGILERSLAIKDRTILSLKTELSEMSSALEQKLLVAHQEAEKVLKEAKQYQGRLAQQENDLKMITGTYDEESKRNDALRQEIEGLKNNLREHNNSKKLMAEMEDEMSEMRATLKIFQREREDDDAHHREIIMDLEQQLSEKLDEIETSKLDACSNIEALQTNNHDLHVELEELRKKYEESKTALEEAVLSKTNKSAAFHSKINELTITIENMGSRHTEEVTKTVGIQGDLSKAKKENNDLKSQLDHHIKQLSISSKRTDELETQLRESHTTVVTLKSALMVKEKEGTLLKSTRIDTRSSDQNSMEGRSNFGSFKRGLAEYNEGEAPRKIVETSVDHYNHRACDQSVAPKKSSISSYRSQYDQFIAQRARLKAEQNELKQRSEEQLDVMTTHISSDQSKGIGSTLTFDELESLR